MASSRAGYSRTNSSSVTSPRTNASNSSSVTSSRTNAKKVSNVTSYLDTMYNNLKIEGSKKLGFGMYSGYTFEEVYMCDISYCKWAMSVDAYNFSMSDFQDYIHKMNRIC